MFLDKEWSFSNDIPIYSQIVEQIKKQIISGKLKPGDRLSTVRDLANEAGVNPNTIQRALSELERMELVYSQRTSGRFITDNEDLIQRAKSEYAGRKIREFLQSMREIGLSEKEIIKIIESEETKNE